MGDRLSLHIERYGGAGLMLAVFAVYMLTLAPGVTFWDSGELILGALTLGVPHPPGASAYCILGKAASFIPIGSGAFRMNAFSAGFGAFCAYLVYALAVSLSDGSRFGRVLGLMAGAGFSLSSPAWSVSVVSEVYTLVCALILLIALCVDNHRSGGGTRWLYAGALLYGLYSLTHQSALFMLPALVLYAAYGAGMHRRPTAAILTLAFFALGLSVIMYLPLRAGTLPLLNIGDPDTLGRLSWVLKLSENMDTATNVIVKLPKIAVIIGAAKLVAATVVFCALFYTFRREPHMLFMLIAAAVMFGCISVLAAGATGLIKWGQTSKFYVLGLSLGLPFMAAALSKAVERRVPGLNRPAGIVMAVPAVAVFGLSAYLGFGGQDRTLDRYAYTFAKDTLNSVGGNSVLVGWGDNGTFPVWYMQEWDRYRDDTLFIHNELLSYGWYVDEVSRLIRVRYGADYKPVAPLTDLKLNVVALRYTLGDKADVYLDFSAIAQLGLKWDRYRPQGMVYLDKRDHARPQEDIWDAIYMPDLVESGADRRFATEGILDIYAYQCYLWGDEACRRKKPDEANEAFAKVEILAPGEFTSECGKDGGIKRTGRSFVK